MNIPSTILQTLTSGNTLNSVSSTLGLTQDQTKRTTSAAVPGLLAGLTGLASTPGGADRLSEAVSRQDTSVVDNFSGALSGRGPQLAQQGSGLLNSLMGGSTMSNLGGVLSRFTGVGEGPMGTLLGLLAPVLLGFLGKQQKTQGLSASGLADLLKGQKDNIRSAMPPGLGTALSSALPGVGQFFGGAGSARAATADSGYVRREEDLEDKRGGTWKTQPVHRATGRKSWAVPLIVILAVLAGLLLWSNHNRRREAVRSSVGAPAAAPERTTGAGGSVVSDTTRLVSQAASTLAGVKDRASAEAAAPKLQNINSQLGNLRSTWQQLPETARTTASSTLQPQIDKLKNTAEPILNQPGVGDVIRPHIDKLMQNLNAISGQ